MTRGDKKKAVLRALKSNPRRTAGDIAKATGASRTYVAELASEYKIPIGIRDTKKIVAAYIARNPGASHEEVAEACGTKITYVMQVSAALRLSGGVIADQFDRDNLSWIERQAHRSGVTVTEFLNAIVTDARLDAEEEA